MAYVPSVGDRVLAHSTGISDSNLVGVYTDDWFPGKIIKVTFITMFFFFCTYGICVFDIG